MRHLKTLQNLVITCSLTLAITGCSVSYSVEQSSESIGGSFEALSGSFKSFTSVSSSSGGDEIAQATIKLFQEDVINLVVLHIQSENLDQYQFQNELNQLAKLHGIINWEGLEETFLAIGYGLKQSGVTSVEIASHQLLNENQINDNLLSLQKGYDFS